MTEFFKELFVAIKEFIYDYVVYPISNIKVIDIFDILILAFVIYLIYKFIKDRRAGKLAIGMMIIIVLLLISSVLEMKALSFVLRNFYQVGFIAIIIVFQPELRAALEKVGTSSIFNFKNIGNDAKLKEEINNEAMCICNAAYSLSNDKTGALIVLEKNTKLGDYTKSGVILDSQVSSHLLRNIFFNKAPLHDGAVIIRDNRIYAAGCFLPLSTRDDIVKDLGTRHRAAIGVSEVSDALVIIVSEENGFVSYAQDGKLYRNIDSSDLNKHIVSFLTPSNLNRDKHTEKTELINKEDNSDEN